MIAHYQARFMQGVQTLPFGSFWVFGLKQAWAALFGGLMLAAILLTEVIDLPYLERYDWLFLLAIAIQLFMLIAKLEQPHEVITIFVFHLVGLGMEVFKTSSQIGSWHYPGHAFFHLAAVPLFSGFMYAAVGSYIARSWRVFELKFQPYPPRWATVVLAIAIYINFFTHHYFYDIRWVLFACVAVLYGRTWVRYTINEHTRRMPLLLGFSLIALVIWLAENIATYSHIWLYPSQRMVWHPVGLGKIGSWLLLMVISFILIDILHATRRHLAGRTAKKVEP